MPINTTTAGWVDALSSELDARADALALQADYYSGEKPDIVLADQSIPMYRTIVNQARTPWAQLIVDIAAERMRVTGFRVVTPESSDEDAEADSLAWDIWQGSNCTTSSTLAFREMLLHSSAGVLVEQTDGLPSITFESPATTTVAYGPGNRSRVAAIKRWRSNNLTYVVLWTPEGAVTLTKDAGKPRANWEQAPTQLAANTFGVVPVFEMHNRPDLLGNHFSDLDGLYPAIDRTIQTAADRLTTQLYASVKVRYILGVEPEFDEAGNPTQQTLKLAVDKLVLLENENAKVGSFDASDLRQFIECYRSDISAMAAIARLPVYLLSGDLVNMSAEALKSTSDGLAARVGQRQVWASPALSGAMRLALAAAGDTRMSDPRTRVEVMWADVLPDSISDMATSAAGLVSSNVLSTTAAQEWALKLTPSQIDKFRQYRRQDDLDSQSTNLSNLFAVEPAAPGPEAEPGAEEQPVEEEAPAA